MQHARMFVVCLQYVVVSVIGHLMAKGRDVKTRYVGGWKSSVCWGEVEIVIHCEDQSGRERPQRNRPVTQFHSGNIVFKRLSCR